MELMEIEEIEELVVFSNPSFEGALIGVTHDNRAVYEYSRMVESLMKENMTEQEAIEWIEYNTIRSLPYTKKSPIVVHLIE